MTRRGSAGVGGTTAKARRRPGPRKGASLPAGTREDLIRAAAEVFAAQGFDGGTAEVIARRAGTTKAMINYHFRSKQGLYEAILTETFGAIAGNLDAVRAAGGTAPEQLRAFVAAFAQAATERPAFPAMMVRELLSGGTNLPEDVFLRMAGVMGVVRSIAEQGIKEGTFRAVDPLITHIGLVGSLLFFFATASFRKQVAPKVGVHGEPPTTADFVAHVQELMVRGLAKGTAPRRRS